MKKGILLLISLLLCSCSQTIKNIGSIVEHTRYEVAQTNDNFRDLFGYMGKSITESPKRFSHNSYNLIGEEVSRQVHDFPGSARDAIVYEVDSVQQFPSNLSRVASGIAGEIPNQARETGNKLRQIPSLLGPGDFIILRVVKEQIEEAPENASKNLKWFGNLLLYPSE